MQNLVDTYSTALLLLILLSLAMAVQSFLAGLYKNAFDAQVSGQIVTGDMNDFTFRVVRTHLNGVENFSAFFAAALLAMIVGVDVAHVSWLVAASVGLRMVYWLIYYARIGKDGGGIRTITYVLGLILNMILAGFAAWQLI